MTTATAEFILEDECYLCDKRAWINDRGWCEACAGLAQHVSFQLRHRGRSRLRTKQRTVAQAERIFALVTDSYGISIDVERGDTWVAATMVEVEDDWERPVVERKRVDGYDLDDLDMGKLMLELVEQRSKVQLMTQMASVDPLSVQRLPAEHTQLNQLEKLVAEKEAWMEAQKEAS